jgi:hypothetical protein
MYGTVQQGPVGVVYLHSEERPENWVKIVLFS